MTDVPPGGGWRSQAEVDSLILAALARIEAKLDAQVEETMSQHLARVVLKEDARMAPQDLPFQQAMADADDARHARVPQDEPAKDDLPSDFRETPNHPYPDPRTLEQAWADLRARRREDEEDGA